MSPLKRFLLLLSAVLCAHTTQAQWVLKKEKDSIRVYTRKNANSAFRSVKAECTATGTISQMAALLSDVDRHKEWVYSIKSARMMQQPNPTEFVYYSEVSAPWPCDNRDFIVTTQMTQPSPGVLVIDSHTLPDLLPEVPGKVRVRYTESHWVLTALGHNRVQVLYTIDFDPGGSVPAWVVNMFVSDGPYKTFKNMKEQLLKNSYSNIHFNFIKE